MKRKLTAALLAALLMVWMVPGAGAAKNAVSSGEALAAFRTFSEDAAGKYVLQREEDTLVLELVPAFGRLFASVMCYMEDSLYSYYAAELTPEDLTRAENRAGNSETSFRLTARAYSNMSRAGRYWPGSASQRLTLIGDLLAVTDFQGDGDALVSKENVFLIRDDDAPGGAQYGPDMASRLYGSGGKAKAPAALTGAWNTSWRREGAEHSLRLLLEADGHMTALLDAADTPPRLLRGGYALSRAENGVYTLFYVMSALDTGTMPHSGWARLEMDDDGLIVSAVKGEECLLLPEGEDMIAYERGEDPLRLGWMRVTDKRDDEDFLDVSVRDPFDGGETALIVMKDGSTTFAWPSNRSMFELMSLRLNLEKGKELPVLYRTRGEKVDLLLVLDDIAEDTRLLVTRAPYFPLLSDYREEVENGSRQGSTASVFFDEAGEPAITLTNDTDYPVQRSLTASIQRRVGRSFTAADGAGNSVTFENWRAGCIAVVDESLRFATHGFPGFEGTYNRTDAE